MNLNQLNTKSIVIKLRSVGHKADHMYIVCTSQRARLARARLASTVRMSHLGPLGAAPIRSAHMQAQTFTIRPQYLISLAPRTACRLPCARQGAPSQTSDMHCRSNAPSDTPCTPARHRKISETRIRKNYMALTYD